MNILQTVVEPIKKLLKGLENLKSSAIFTAVNSTLSIFFSGNLRKGKAKLKILIIDVYKNTAGSISTKIEAAAKSITKTLINGIHVGPLIDFIVGNPYRKPAQENWDKWGMENMTAINVPTWQLFFTVIYIVSSQLLAQAVAYFIKVLTELYLVTQYASDKSPFAVKYAAESLQALIIYGTQISTAWIFLYLLLKIVKSIKR